MQANRVCLCAQASSTSRRAHTHHNQSFTHSLFALLAIAQLFTLQRASWRAASTVPIASSHHRNQHARIILLGGNRLIPMGYLILSPRQRLSLCVSFKGASTQARGFFEALDGETCPIGAGAVYSEQQLANNRCFGCRGYSEWPFTTASGMVPDSSRSLSCEERAYNRTALGTTSFLHVLLLRDPLERLVSAYLDRCAGRTGLKCRTGLCMCKHEERPTMDGFLRLLANLGRAKNASGGRLIKTYDHHFREQMADCAVAFSSHQQPLGFRVIRWKAYGDRGNGSGMSLHSQMMDVCKDRAFNLTAQLICEKFFARSSNSLHRTDGRVSHLWKANAGSTVGGSGVGAGNRLFSNGTRQFDLQTAMVSTTITDAVRDLYRIDYAAFERLDLCAGLSAKHRARTSISCQDHASHLSK